MPDEVHDFLDQQRVGVISVEMPNGAPHGSTVHFAYQRDPLTFVFLTDRTYRKVEPMQGGASTRASFVVGTDESQMRTLQLDGTARLTDSELHWEAYFSKFPEKREQYGDPDDVFFVFTPTWWRYTNYQVPEGKQVIESL